MSLANRTGTPFDEGGLVSRTSARRAAVVGAVGILLTGCGAPASDLGESADTPSATSSAASSAASSAPGTATTSAPAVTATTSAPARTVSAAASDPSRRYAVVTMGRYGADPAARSFAAYAVARIQMYVTKNPGLPALKVVTTPAFLRQQQSLYRANTRKGWTVPAPTRWSVVGVGRTAGAATVRVCLWGPSSAYIDAKSRRRVEKTDNRWYAGTVGMVRTGGRWRVSSALDASFSCASAR